MMVVVAPRYPDRNIAGARGALLPLSRKMLVKPVHSVLCSVAGVAAGAGTLFACLALDTAPTVTAVLPVGCGVCVRQMVLSVMKRRAWQRANNERS
jgi:hypothetical protein